MAPSQCHMEGPHLQVQAVCKWPIYWLQPWHLLLSQSIKHCRLASLDLSWAQPGSPVRLSIGGGMTLKPELLKESWDGAHPQPFHRNLGAAGYQPGACLHVSSCPGSSLTCNWIWCDIQNTISVARWNSQRDHGGEVSNQHLGSSYYRWTPYELPLRTLSNLIAQRVFV